MLGSRSNFFKRSKEDLNRSHRQMVRYLVSNNYSLLQIGIYEKAFEYFCMNYQKYDGATIVKDLHHIPGLDINAMLHDYHYLVYKSGCNLHTKWMADLLYAKEMERTGKGLMSWIHFTGLKLTGIPFLIYSRITKGKPSDQQKRRLYSDYIILTKN